MILFDIYPVMIFYLLVVAGIYLIQLDAMEIQSILEIRKSNTINASLLIDNYDINIESDKFDTSKDRDIHPVRDPLTDYQTRQLSSLDHSKRRCGDLDHAKLTRPCSQNDTHCGDWSERFFHPPNCVYQDITTDQARQCLGNRTIAFIGDSIIRDIALGLSNLLAGKYDLQTAPDVKFDHHNVENRRKVDPIPQIKHWKERPEGYGFILPREISAKKHSFHWQIQYWSLYDAHFLEKGELFEILNNSMAQHVQNLREIDIAFVEFGLHNMWWDTDGEQYYNKLVKFWLNARSKAIVPSVWIAMNPNCEELLRLQSGPLPDQQLRVEVANYYTNWRTLKDKLPYWDAAAPLRTPDRCKYLDDGLHVKMFVDIMRAKMLLNHLCDSNMNWRGSLDFFR